MKPTFNRMNHNFIYVENETYNMMYIIKIKTMN
jgi:hypothetical protein